ncbi:MAG: hypothetical protein EOR81_02195 [Mesorhizobium sp.]|nr:MAG: hypothetical protein EOR81_02195 [Mesorhizobium sp.]
MAKVRSPNYPNTDLGSALAMARKIYEKDNRNKVPQLVIAQHLGHEGLSGPALGKLGAMRAYGLLDGSGDELRVTDDALTAIMAPEGSPDQRAALGRLASQPSLFRDIRKELPGFPSEPSLRWWLAKRGFSPEAAAKAIKAYLGTLRLVPESSGSYNPQGETSDEEATMEPEQIAAVGSARPALRQHWSQMARPIANEVQPGTRQEIITLDEGDVTITFPENLSPDSFMDLKEHLELFLKKMTRRAERAQEAAADDKAKNVFD